MSFWEEYKSRLRAEYWKILLAVALATVLTGFILWKELAEQGLGISILALVIGYTIWFSSWFLAEFLLLSIQRMFWKIVRSGFFPILWRRIKPKLLRGLFTVELLLMGTLIAAHPEWDLRVLIAHWFIGCCMILAFCLFVEILTLLGERDGL